MTQEEKDLLLKDLSTRLPYGVKCQAISNDSLNGVLTLKGIGINYDGQNTLFDFDYSLGNEKVDLPIQYYISEIKPYLFPLSSMTEEQRQEFNELSDLEIDGIPIYKAYYRTPTICSKNEIGVEGEPISIEITQHDIIPVID